MNLFVKSVAFSETYGPTASDIEIPLEAFLAQWSDELLANGFSS